MKRTLTITLKAVVLAGLAVLFCTKLPANMDKLEQNIGATSLVSPADGSTDNILSPRLVWGPVGGATRYSVQLSTESDFSGIILEDTAVTDTFTVAAGLDYKTMYYWRVRVHDATSTSDWTSHRIFTTIIEPQRPAVALPLDSANAVPTTMTLTWNPAVGAASYFVQVASDTAFTAIVAADSTLADTSKVVRSLSNNSTYYWRVRSGNPGGASAWTATRKFTTIVAAPESPGLSTPANGADDQPLSLVLTWNKADGASGYYLQVATDIAFTNIFLQDSVLTDTTRAVTGLANGVMYYWRTRASNDGGSSAWSLVSGFKTFSAVPQQPQLCLPADGAADQTIPLMVTWNKAVGAASYHVQVAADSAFGLMTFIDSTLSDTAKSVGGLANSTKYFWRVRAKNPTGVSSWSARRSFTTFAATLSIPVLRQPADGASGQPTALALSWQRVSGAKTYRVQMSTVNDFSTIFLQDTGLTDTTRTLASGVLANSATYYWRVRAEDAGQLSNWTSPWRFTTVMAAPQIPLLLSPPDGATAQQLTLVLSWNKAAGAATYILQVSPDSGFATIVAGDTALVDTAKNIGVPSNNKTYYWRVGSKNAVGTSGWSGRRSFTTFDPTLLAPTLQSPSDGARDIPLSTGLSWSTSAGATTYEVQVSTVRDFTTVFIDDATPTGGTKSLAGGGLLYSTTYYWRVMARNLSGNSNWTDAWSFTTIITTPGTPSPVVPNDNAADQPVSVGLTWNKATGASTYYVKVASDTGFTAIVSADSTLTDTTKSITGLSNSATYYWKVKGRNASGDGTWSATRSFTTIIAAPAAPALSSPSSGSSDIDVSPQLAWSSVTGAAAYHIQVSKDSAFSTGLVVDDSTYTQTAKLIGPLARSTLYYWHVKAKNAGGTGAWSAPWKFMTIPAAPPAPVLVSPADAALDQPVSLTLRWNKATGASVYFVHAATDTGFYDIVKNDSTASPGDTSMDLAGLANGTTYYWRVMAKNAGGAVFSVHRSFTTVTGVPSAPVLVSPADAAAELPVPLTLTWNKCTGASAYYVSVSTDAGFSVIVKADTTPSLTDTSIAVSGLGYGTTYFWQVQAKGATGTSSPSSHRRFTTISQFAISITAVNGSVTKSPNQAQYDSGTVVSLIPSAATGYHFTGWSGDLTGMTNPGNIVVNSAKNVTAGFGVDTPAAPTLVSPADAAASLPTSQTLTWNKVAIASTYHVTVATDAVFYTIVKDDFTSSPDDTAMPLSGLSSGSTYFWRVQAMNAAAAGPWSLARSFTTCRQFALYITGAYGTVTRSPSQTYYDSGTVVSLTAAPSGGYHFDGWGGDLSGTTNPTSVTMNAIRNIIVNFVSDAPPVPTLLFPGTGTTNVHLGPTLKWYSSTGTTYYRLQASTSSGFTTGMVFDDSTLTDTTKAIGPLNTGITYYWHVRTKNAIAASNWSSTYSFSTFAMPAAPSLSSPLSDATDQPQNPVLSWSTVSGAANYDLQVSTHSDFSVVDVKDQVQSGLSYQLGSLLANANYYWRVKAISADTTSAWSAVWKFTTVALTWGKVNAGLTDSIVEAFLVNGSNIFAGTYTQGLFLSSNEGTNWTPANSGITNMFVRAFTMSSSNIFAGTDGGGVFLSANNGGTWTAVNSGFTTSDVYSLAANGTNIYAGTNSGVYLSTNNGTSWTPIDSGLTNNFVWSLAVIGNNILAGTDIGVFLSTNNGTSWTLVNSSPSVYALAVSGGNVFAGTMGSGVFLSTNNGASWTAATSGLYSQVASLAVSGSNIFAGTLAYGVYLSTNNGTSWTAVNNGLTNLSVYSLGVSGTNIFAGTLDGGIFRSPLP